MSAEKFLNSTFVSHPYTKGDTWIPRKRALASIEAALASHTSALAERDAEIASLRGQIKALSMTAVGAEKEADEAHAENARLRGKIEEAIQCFDVEPEYHDQGMGCGLEDRGITDRYDAMAHGWEQAMERVYGENIAWAKDVLTSALAKEPMP